MKDRNVLLAVVIAILFLALLNAPTWALPNSEEKKCKERGGTPLYIQDDGYTYQSCATYIEEGTT